MNDQTVTRKFNQTVGFVAQDEQSNDNIRVQIILQKTGTSKVKKREPLKFKSSNVDSAGDDNKTHGSRMVSQNNKPKTTKKLTLLNLRGVGGEGDNLDHEVVLLDDYTFSKLGKTKTDLYLQSEQVLHNLILKSVIQTRLNEGESDVF